MKVLQHIKQGSDEWLQWRNNGIGGSDVASIMHKSPWKKIDQLWLEKTGQAEPEDMSSNFIVQRGHALEPEARTYFEDMSGKKFDPALFEHDEFTFLKYSSDGYNEELNEIIEIKCNGDKSHQLALCQQLPDYYMLQIQYGLMVSNAKKCYYISYNPNHESPFVSFQIMPDKELQEKILTKTKRFWLSNVLDKKIPMTLQQEEEVKDKAFEALCLKYKEKFLTLEKMEEELNIIKKDIEANLINKGLKRANCANVFIQQIERAGSVDYSKVPELKGVDLEQYRKKGTSYYQIKIEKK
jgi:putative phage-type endonuclease